MMTIKILIGIIIALIGAFMLVKDLLEKQAAKNATSFFPFPANVEPVQVQRAQPQPVAPAAVTQPTRVHPKMECLEKLVALMDCIDDKEKAEYLAKELAPQILVSDRK